MSSQAVYPFINPQFTSLEKMVSDLADKINIHYDVDMFKAEQEKNNLVFR